METLILSLANTSKCISHRSQVNLQANIIIWWQIACHYKKCCVNAHLSILPTALSTAICYQAPTIFILKSLTDQSHTYGNLPQLQNENTGLWLTLVSYWKKKEKKKKARKRGKGSWIPLRMSAQILRLLWWTSRLHQTEQSTAKNLYPSFQTHHSYFRKLFLKIHFSWFLPLESFWKLGVFWYTLKSHSVWIVLKKCSRSLEQKMHLHSQASFLLFIFHGVWKQSTSFTDHSKKSGVF